MTTENGDIQKLSIIDRVIQATTDFHKKNQLPHFIFLGANEINELKAELNKNSIAHFLKIAVEDDNKVLEISGAFSVLSYKLLDCFVIEYPSNSFFKVV